MDNSTECSVNRLDVFMAHFLVVPLFMVLPKQSAGLNFLGTHIKLIISCFNQSFIHQYCMKNNLESFWRIFEFRKPCANLLSVSNGVLVGGCFLLPWLATTAS